MYHLTSLPNLSPVGYLCCLPQNIPSYYVVLWMTNSFLLLLHISGRLTQVIPVRQRDSVFYWQLLQHCHPVPWPLRAYQHAIHPFCLNLAHNYLQFPM